MKTKGSFNQSELCDQTTIFGNAGSKTKQFYGLEELLQPGMQLSSLFTWMKRISLACTQPMITWPWFSPTFGGSVLRLWLTSLKPKPNTRLHVSNCSKCVLKQPPKDCQHPLCAIPLGAVLKEKHLLTWLSVDLPDNAPPCRVGSFEKNMTVRNPATSPEPAWQRQAFL